MVDPAKLNGLQFFIRGALFLHPVPYHRGYHSYAAGLAVSSWTILVILPVAALIGLGFVLGRYL